MHTQVDPLLHFFNVGFWSTETVVVPAGNLQAITSPKVPCLHLFSEMPIHSMLDYTGQGNNLILKKKQPLHAHLRCWLILASVEVEEKKDVCPIKGA